MRWQPWGRKSAGRRRLAMDRLPTSRPRRFSQRRSGRRLAASARRTHRGSDGDLGGWDAALGVMGENHFHWTSLLSIDGTFGTANQTKVQDLFRQPAQAWNGWLLLAAAVMAGVVVWG